MDYGMYQNYNIESAKDVNITNKEMVDYNMPTSNGTVMPQVTESPQERQIHRKFIHCVPHVCPVHTRIVNHHVYKHTYTPCYTCSEENVIDNCDPGCGCSMF